MANNGCCAGVGNLRFAFSHRSMHMAADMKVGSTLYLGPNHREGRVEEIVQPFTTTDNTAALIVKVTFLNGGGTATVTFKNLDGVFVAQIDETTAAWGLKGHFRNTHAPSSPRNESQKALL